MEPVVWVFFWFCPHGKSKGKIADTLSFPPAPLVFSRPRLTLPPDDHHRQLPFRQTLFTMAKEAAPRTGLAVGLNKGFVRSTVYFLLHLLHMFHLLLPGGFYAHHGVLSPLGLVLGSCIDLGYG